MFQQPTAKGAKAAHK